MKSEWAEEINWWLKPPFHSKEQTQQLKLTSEHKKHAEPKPGHFRLRGPAGSGKTLIVAYRAAKLASQGNKVLVVNFNITLWHYIKDMIARTPFNKFDLRGNISLNHFHGFCKDVLNELDVPSPAIETYFKDISSTVKYAFKTANKRGENVDHLKYDAILIDEGQDYEWEWYDCLREFLTERDELLLVCDKKQNIYKRNLNWTDEVFSTQWRELKTVHRLPKKIGDAANEFSKLFGLDQSLEVEDLEYVQLKLFELKPHLVWKNIQIKDWRDHIKDAYEQIKAEQIKSGGGHPSDITILFPNREIGISAVKHFEKQNIRVNHVFEDECEREYHRHKKSFWVGDGRLKMSTFHSFKGWEARHVILLIPNKWMGDENLDSLVYTSMTRTLENLIVLNCNERYVEFGKTLPSEWDNQ